MQCPVDNETLLMTERLGVAIDYCPRCRGVWLDRGELDKLIEVASRQSMPAVSLAEPVPASEPVLPAEPAASRELSPPPPPPPPAQATQRSAHLNDGGREEGRRHPDASTESIGSGGGRGSDRAPRRADRRDARREDDGDYGKWRRYGDDDDDDDDDDDRGDRRGRKRRGIGGLLDEIFDF